MPKRGRPQPLHLYQLLPGTNCRLCGCNGCFAFAFSLISREKRIEDCPDLLSEAFISSFRKLNELIGKAEIIQGTDFALDRDICTGCGDCSRACERVITFTNPGAGMVSRRSMVPPVLQVIDGIIQVLNWSSCKRMMDPPVLCRVCAEKCPFGALELVK